MLHTRFKAVTSGRLRLLLAKLTSTYQGYRPCSSKSNLDKSDIVLTAYLFVCNYPPRIAFALRDAATPFQIKARARKAGAEQSVAVWQFITIGKSHTLAR